MTSCRHHRAARALFVSLLALGLAAVLINFRLVHSKASVTKHPQGGKVSALETAKVDQDAQNRSQLSRLMATAQTDNTHHHSNRTEQGNATDRGVPSNPLSGRHIAHNNSSAVRLTFVPVQFPLPTSSALEVTVTLPGMLGNHMFQYASLLGIAHMNGRRPFCKPSSSLHKFFQVTHIQDRSDKGFVVVGEKNFATFDPSFQHLPNDSVILAEYLQSWKYFDFIQDTIKQEFRFKQYLKSQAANLLKRFATKIEHRVKVGIHVRRGDMVSTSSRNKGYHTAPASYLFKAMDYMRQKHGDVIFIVVSDDLIWCRNTLSNAADHVIADSAPGEVHLALLASCDHVIMTVGTYGWWGGYLSGGDVVYYWDPKECLHHPPLPVEIKHPEDFFLPSWIPLPG